MISKVKKWLQLRLEPASTSQALGIDLATAVLYVEVARADNQFEESEIQFLTQLLKKEFSVSESQAQALVRDSRQHAEQAADLVSFTRLLNQQYSGTQKVQILENLWQLAYADGHLDSHEEHIIRRIADLLYIPHSQFIQAKIKAQD
ncbi:TerB family tellurite resistance protein [Bowmanella sp. Y26]|uniref:tellurite resistance TerB family protein n=1 Tax=Bowmanella yangjiangensis TaxID=2811230 RepID=UPI001BDC3FAF|nr:TerB family tellurite resistance protein [Bowmanella yangjiangensis]MBT1063090.1 TerB family tellurite resistance protein [Bowmanella yangjiangensis]